MSEALIQADTALFKLLNGLHTPSLDVVMPWLSDNALFLPALLLAIIWVAWKGSLRARVCALFLILTVSIGDGIICKNLKEEIGRKRPCKVLAEAHVPHGIGCTDSGSFPSSHAANWFSAVVVCSIFYKRRGLAVSLPPALLVAYSRIYNGVHYPADILGAAVIATAYAGAIVFLAHLLWINAGPKWFPRWFEKFPSLIDPTFTPGPPPTEEVRRVQWLRAGYVLIGFLLIVRLFYIGSGKIELSEDEAYQWTWSKHLALSYYSKPPLIAYTQWLGTSLFGDTAFGVRFFSPIIASLLALVIFRFIAREAGVRPAFVLLLVFMATPLLAVGATLMTIDPLSVLFWTLVMVAGWKAASPEGATRHWLLVGLFMGLGFLSKYTNLIQWICWIVLFVLYKPARIHLRKPGPYLAFLVNALFTLPVIIWNAQNDWITVAHVASDGRLDQPWKPTLRYFWDFIGSESALLNPIFFWGAVSACILFWKRKNPLQLFLFSMGAPLLLFYWLFTFKSRVLPNWIAPSVVPLFCFMVLYWRPLYQQRKWVRRLFGVGLTLGIPIVILLHDTNLVNKLVKRPLPAKVDPLRRVRSWSETARVVEEQRQKLEAEGKPAFVIGDHYGITGLLSFYIPAAKTNVQTNPLVFYRTAEHPENQFYFFPGYTHRKGQNAIYVQRVDEPRLPKRWFIDWIAGNPVGSTNASGLIPVPPSLTEEFESVRDLGVHEVHYRGRVLHRFQLFQLRNLR